MTVGVIMPCQTAVEFARPAVESILTQTHHDLELVVVDDAGPEETAHYLRSVKDSRLSVLRNEQAKGIAGSLNLALTQLHTTWVCRMDADDIAMPHRLAAQAAFATKHPDVAVFGSNVELFGTPPGLGHSDLRVPAEHEDIAYRLLWSNALNHPTVMFRREVVQSAGGYDDSHYCSEDYDLWTRLVLRHALANLPDKLLRYRLHPAQASSLQGERKTKDVSQSRARYQQALIGMLAPPVFENPGAWTAGQPLPPADWMQWVNYLHAVKQRFAEGRLGERRCRPRSVGRDLARRLYHRIQLARRLGWHVPPELPAECRQLSPFYAFSKGIW